MCARTPLVGRGTRARTADGEPHGALARRQAGSGLVRVEARDEYSADVFLRRDLDHEVRHEYSQMSGPIM